MDEKCSLAIENLLNKHLAKRKGERYRRLKEGLGHAEQLFLQQVWWPAFGSFTDLHPEYEVKDFRDGTRFLDFAFLRHSLKLAIEIDGYGPHASQISRAQFADQWIRQNHLIIDGWKILRFSFDDVKARPRMCEQMLQQFMGRFLGWDASTDVKPSYVEKEVIRFALSLNRPLTPHDVCEILSIKKAKARQMLKTMLEKSLIQAVGNGSVRIRKYSVTASTLQQFNLHW